MSKIRLIIFVIIGCLMLATTVASAAVISRKDLRSYISDILLRSQELQVTPDMIRLINISNGDIEIFKSLLTLEPSSVQNSLKNFSSFLYEVSSVVNASDVHLKISQLPELYQKFVQNPGQISFTKMISELKIVSYYLSIESDQFDPDQRATAQYGMELVTYFCSVVGSLDSSGGTTLAKYLVKNLGTADIVTFNPYIWQQLQNGLSSNLMAFTFSSDNYAKVNFAELAAFNNFSSLLHIRMATDPIVIGKLFPVIMDLESRLGDFIRHENSLNNDYIQRLGLPYQNSISVPTNMNVDPGYAFYLNYMYKIESATFAMQGASVAPNNSGPFSSPINNLYSQMSLQNSQSLKNINDSFVGIPYFSRLPFLGLPGVDSNKIDQDSFLSLLETDAEISRLIFEVGGLVGASDVFLRDNLVYKDFLASVADLVSNLASSPAEIKRISSLIDGDDSLEKLVHENFLVNELDQSFYKGAVNVGIHKVFAATNSPKISYFQRMLSIEIIRILRTSDPVLQNFRIQDLLKVTGGVMLELKQWQ